MSLTQDNVTGVVMLEIQSDLCLVGMPRCLRTLVSHKRRYETRRQGIMTSCVHAPFEDWVKFETARITSQSAIGEADLAISFV